MLALGRCFGVSGFGSGLDETWIQQLYIGTFIGFSGRLPSLLDEASCLDPHGFRRFRVSRKLQTCTHGPQTSGSSLRVALNVKYDRLLFLYGVKRSEEKHETEYVGTRPEGNFKPSARHVTYVRKLHEPIISNALQHKQLSRVTCPTTWQSPPLSRSTGSGTGE